MFSNTNAPEHTHTRVLEHSSNTALNTDSNTLTLVAFTLEHVLSKTPNTKILEHTRTQFSNTVLETLKNLWFSCILRPQGSGNLEKPSVFL